MLSLWRGKLMSLITHSTLVNYVYQGRTLKCHDIIFHGNGVINGTSKLFDDITDILNIDASSGNLEFVTKGKRIRVYGEISAAKNITIHSDKLEEFTTSGNIYARGNATVKNINQISSGRYISSHKKVKAENSKIGSVIADGDIELNNIEQISQGDFINGKAGLTVRNSNLCMQVRAHEDIKMHNVKQAILGNVISQNGAITLSDNCSIGDAEAFNNITISKNSTVSSANSLFGRVISAESGLWRNLLAMFSW